MTINYEAGKRLFPKQRAALTRAEKKPESQRYAAVRAACVKAVNEWETIFGAWPDDWSRWQRALSDAANAHTRATGVYVEASLLENLIK